MLPGCFLGFYLLKSQAGLELCDGAVLQNRTHVVAVQIACKHSGLPPISILLIWAMVPDR